MVVDRIGQNSFGTSGIGQNSFRHEWAWSRVFAGMDEIGQFCLQEGTQFATFPLGVGGGDVKTVLCTPELWGNPSWFYS